MTRILPSHLDELECQAEEEALRAATLRDRAKLDEFAGRAEKALRGLKAIEKAAEEAIYEMDRERKQREMSARAQTWCKAHELVDRAVGMAVKCAAQLRKFESEDMRRSPVEPQPIDDGADGVAVGANIAEAVREAMCEML